MEAHNELLIAILKQAVRDYIKLDPDSDSSTAEFYESESEDFKTAENFLYNGATFSFGTVVFSYDSLCSYLNINPKTLKKKLGVKYKLGIDSASKDQIAFHLKDHLTDEEERKNITDMIYRYDAFLYDSCPSST